MEKISIENFDYDDFIHDVKLISGSNNITIDNEYYNFSINNVPDENTDSLEDFFKNGKYSELIWAYDSSYSSSSSTDYFASIPVVDAVKIAQNFEGVVIWCENEGSYRSLKIKDKNSNYSLWIDVSYNKDWQFNKCIFILSNSKDVIDKSLQFNEIFIQKISDIVDNF